MNFPNLRRGIVAILLWGFLAAASAAPRLRVAAFRADATPERGEPLIWVAPVSKVEDPLWAKGVVIEEGERRFVLCAVDWCGIGGATDLLFRSRIAAAASTSIERVALHSVHQHAAPYIDGDGYRILASMPSPPLMMSTAFLERVAGRMAEAVRDAVGRLQPFDRLGTGEARVDRVASARRVFQDGKLITRYSTGGSDPQIAALPEGSIDPVIRTLTLAAGERPLVRLHYYATHPQTFCCDGRVSADFVGAAREEVEAEEGVVQVYFTGCSGDVTVGKYNDKSDAARQALQSRLAAAMKASIASTHYEPFPGLRWRRADLALPPKTDGPSAPEALRRRLEDPTRPSGDEKYRTAITLAFSGRRRPLPASSLQMGKVWLIHLPGEPMIEFQKYAQALRPGLFVAVAGYGDMSPGYLCTDRAFAEGGYEPGASNAGPGTEARVRKAIRKLLGL